MALERVSLDTNTFWVDARRRSAIVVLQDRVRHVGEAVDGCRKSLTTMFSVMLHINPLPEKFGQLLKVFKMSRHIHRLIELNLVAGATFAIGWAWKWHSRLNFNTISWVCLHHKDPDLRCCRSIWMLLLSLQEG
jgi:hypothetical protein